MTSAATVRATFLELSLDVDQIEATLLCPRPRAHRGAAAWLRDPDGAQSGAVAALRPQRGTILAIESAGR